MWLSLWTCLWEAVSAYVPTAHNCLYESPSKKAFETGKEMPSGHPHLSQQRSVLLPWGLLCICHWYVDGGLLITLKMSDLIFFFIKLDSTPLPPVEKTLVSLLLFNLFHENCKLDPSQPCVYIYWLLHSLHLGSGASA
jgi:hypothetical protein